MSRTLLNLPGRSRGASRRSRLPRASATCVCSAGDGRCKREQEAQTPINDKLIVFGLQAHQLSVGIIRDFHGDRGGQVFMYQPKLP